MSRFLLLFSILCTISLSSCVTGKKFNEQLNLAEKYKAERDICQENLAESIEGLKEQATLIGDFERKLKGLNTDTLNKGRKLRQNQQLSKELEDLYESVVEQNKSLLSKSSREKEALSLALSEKERELLKKQQMLNGMENDLQDRSKRVNELEGLISRKDSAVIGLKNKLLGAMTGYGDEELSVEIRDGKVYVTLSEQLLFASGSRELDKKGEQAIGKLAAVLKKQEDLEIYVEGHTDSDRFIGTTGQIRNNWDLSVMRATKVTEILTREGVEPERIIASGRSMFFPVAENETKEGKAKNRRTEIILSPDLSEILSILGEGSK